MKIYLPTSDSIAVNIQPKEQANPKGRVQTHPLSSVSRKLVPTTPIGFILQIEGAAREWDGNSFGFVFRLKLLDELVLD